MALVKLDKVAQGMVLAEDVHDINARLLLAKGQPIEDRHLRMLKMWGVFEVQVEGSVPEAAESNGTMDEAHMFAAVRATEHLFSAIETQHPAVREIMRIVGRHRPRFAESGHAPMALKASSPIGATALRGMTAEIDHMDIQLPEVPSMVYELNDIIADPFSSSGNIAEVVAKSPSLAALLLKIVNSAFYGLRSKIDSISRAVTLIGSKEVSHLALGITIMETFRSIPRQVIDVASFMAHNLACGIVARIISAHGSISTHTEQMFVSGMLHDIGRLVLCKYFPKQAMATMIHAQQHHQPLFKSEKALLGTTHCRIGKKLLRKWKLPYVLENNITYHHRPAAAPSPEMAATIQMADLIVHALGIGCSGETVVPTFDVPSWERVQLPVSAFTTILNQAGHQMEAIGEVLR